VYIALAGPAAETGARDGARLNSWSARKTVASPTDRARRGDHDAQGKSEAISLDPDKIEDGGLGIASVYNGSIQDYLSLGELRAPIQARGRVRLAVLRAECDHIQIGSKMSKEQAVQAGRVLDESGLVAMYAGRGQEASTSFQKALEIGRSTGIPSRVRSDLMALLGIVALRRGEIENCIACVGPSSGIFPVVTEAVHTQELGSREASDRFTACLDE
jgi:hypothetical protein